jgi:phosphoglycolate phosphatase
MNKETDIKLLIFDFDGTIADSFEVFVTIINQIILEEKGSVLSKREIDNLREMKTREIFKYLGFSLIKMPFYAKRVRSEMKERFGEVELFEGIDAVLRKLKKQDKKLVLLSSNSEEVVYSFLEKNNLAFFDKVEAGVNPFAKASRINKILKVFKGKKESAVLLGDEVRDIRAAHKAGIFSAAVTWGYNGKGILKASSPDFLLEKPEDILKIN